MSRLNVWLALAIPGLLVPHTAMAGLGGAVDLGGADHARMQVRLHAATPAGAGALHRLTLGNGGEVREYTNSAGVVYALRWTGPGKPDLKTLLGPHFAALQADNPVNARHGLRRAPMVNRTDLRIVTGGHAGAFWGYAWLPQTVPAGFDPAAL
jgi:hypothetical protein